MADSTQKRGMGWIPDYPDSRDYTEETEEAVAVLKREGFREIPESGIDNEPYKTIYTLPVCISESKPLRIKKRRLPNNPSSLKVFLSPYFCVDPRRETKLTR